MNEDIAVGKLVMWMNVIIIEEGSLGFEVVSRFSDIEPEVILDGKGVKLSFFCHFREYFCFEHAKSLWQSVQNWGVDDIEAPTDIIANKFFGFFNELMNFACLFVSEYYSEAWGIFDTS